MVMLENVMNVYVCGREFKMGVVFFMWDKM